MDPTIDQLNNFTDSFTTSRTNSSFPRENDALGPLNDTILEPELDVPTWVPSFSPSPKPTLWPTPPPTNVTGTGLLESTDSVVLRGTIQVYGTLYLLLLALFCVLRKKYSRLYNIRAWVDGLECQLAKDAQHYGLISWIWEVYQVDEDDILDQCGMDALCFIRVLRIGRKLALMGCFHACWLIPVYATAEDSAETYYLEDRLVVISTAHLPSGSTRFLATVICAYTIFIYCMWLMKQELQWYTIIRHKFLRQRRPRNYAIYVSGIPEELRSGAKLAEFFRQSGATSSVLEAHVTLACPELESLVAQREIIKDRLEHAKAYEEIHGSREKSLRLNLRGFSVAGASTYGQSRSSQTSRMGLVATIDSIEVLELKLRQLTKDIAIAYQQIERGNDPYTLEEHRDMVMAEIEETRRAERVQNIANRERVNSFHDMDNVEEICHFEMNSSPEKNLKATENFSKVAEAFFFGGALSPRQRAQEQQNLLKQEADKAKRNEGFGVTWPDGWPEPQPDDEPEFDLGRDDRGRPNRKMIHNAFPSKSTISTVPGTFENQTSTKWYRGRPGRVVTMSSMDEEDSSVNSNEIDNSDEKDYKKVLRALDHMQSNKDISDDSDGSNDELKGSNRSWQSNTASVFKRVGYGVQALGGDVGKTVVGVGTGVGKVTKQMGEFGVKNVQNVAGNVNKIGLQAAELGVGNMKTIRDSAAAVVPVVMAHEEGKALEAGFVVFKDLYSTQSALQMLHHKEAGVMKVEEAPGPGEIFWRNVGLPDSAQRTGRLLSLTATVFLCLFWTVPVSFVSALTEVNSLKENLPSLATAVEEYPRLESVLALIAPLLLLILQDVLLPEFLKWFAAWEGHISSSALEAAWFVKYAAFVLVQTFFISAISGSISAELSNMLNEPDQIITFLANALPAQSNYFLQILVVAMAVTMGMEMLRVMPLSLAFARRYLGPNLTEEERRKKWKFLSPLEDPYSFEHANISGSLVLYFMVFYTYSCVAPVSSFFLLIMFVCMESGYRYNIFCNYPPTPDSGGKHWKGFLYILLACMIVAQLTLMGFLVLKGSLFALPFMVPLLVVSILFILYINQSKLPAAEHLPTSDCVAMDKNNQLKDFNFAKNKYVQPSILEAQSDEVFELI